MNVLLRGPSSCYILHDQQNDIKYILFGDYHFSLNNICPQECTQMSDLDIFNATPNCWDITFMLYFLFQQNKQMDFYLETPFIPKGQSLPKISSVGYLFLIEDMFRNCFNKVNCEFPNVRFHYVDIRHEREIEYTRSNNIDNILLDEIKNYSKDYNKLNIMNTLMNFFYQHVRGETPSIHLFNLSLNSHNYVEDVEKYLQNLIDVLSLEDYDKFIKPLIEYLIVQRDGMIMHRIGAQLYTSTQSDAIIKYVTDYRLKANEKELLKIWNEYYQLILSELSKPTSTTLSKPMLSTLGKGTMNQKRVKAASFKRLQNFLIHRGASYFDAYFLGRFFRQFEPKSKTKIVFAGNTHIKRYVEFLLNLKHLTLLFSTDVKELRCIHININDFL